jgi:GDPmannose 4,6-dehydratase
MKIGNLEIAEEWNGRVAICSGVTGMDGSNLSELLLKKGYKVIGLMRRASTPNDYRLKDLNKVEAQLPERFIMEYWDLIDDASIRNVIKKYQPTHFFNTAAMSHVQISFPTPIATLEYNAVGVLRILEAIKEIKPDCRFLQASSSEMFGLTPPPQNELTTMKPSSPYGVAKLAAFHLGRIYRDGYGLFACNTICFNHEGTRRGVNFVTRKVTQNIAKIVKGDIKRFTLGNLDALRDWGDSLDYCVDLDTKILTKEGFKSREELSIGEKIINFNQNKNIWEEDEVVKIYDIPFVGNMYTFKGNNLNFRCSENHRILYKEKTKQHKAWNDLKWKETNAGEIYLKFKDKKLRDKYDFCFPGFCENNNLRGEFDINEDMLRLIGWILTEGWLTKSKKIGGGITLATSQSKKKYYSEIKTCLNNLKLDYSEYERDDGTCSFVFKQGSRDEILEYFDDLDIHKMPCFIFKLSSKQLKILFETMMLADGSFSNMGYYSSNRKLAEDFQAVASLIGYKTSLRKNKAGSYVVTMFNDARKSKNIFVTEIEKESVEENIWCVETVKNKTIITKKMDSMFVSGNCKAMEMIINHDTPDDFVVATNETHSIKEFLAEAFGLIGLNWEDYIDLSDRYKRPIEVPALLGNPAKFENTFNWTPPTKFKELVTRMLEADLKEIANCTLEEAKEKMNGK